MNPAPATLAPATSKAQKEEAYRYLYNGGYRPKPLSYGTRSAYWTYARDLAVWGVALWSMARMIREKRGLAVLKCPPTPHKEDHPMIGLYLFPKGGLTAEDLGPWKEVLEAYAALQGHGPICCVPPMLSALDREPLTIQDDSIPNPYPY